MSERAEAPKRRWAGVFNLHPGTGALVLGIDWLLFSGEVISAGAATPITAVLGGLSTGLLSHRVQTKLAHDPPRAALVKAVLAGVAVALPFPIGGTALGTLILASSGLRRLGVGR